MPNFLTNLTFKPTDAPSFKSYRSLIALFIVFLFIGLAIGYMINQQFLPMDSQVNSLRRSDTDTIPSSVYEGVVTYIEPFMYPDDKISYELTDRSGNEIILLKAKDQKLEVSEGHYVQVSGQKRKVLNGNVEYLLVDRLVVKNAAN